ncbi:PIN domain-containing protein [Patescibacteria group bacterium]|jgi:predicted nucleic acid-binding protein|nr:PIN domain-containing protein [Patescibacteria group bacterium]MBU1256322.1 PIN domain-containing protein [Patescibacteria group bacterium]MBU1457080.1 PIN domain-containing protein [Patescibacteria group bacterium]
MESKVGRLLIVVDADAIVAQVFKGDSNHARATEIVQKLMKAGVKIIYPVTAVCEAVTVIQRVLGSKIVARETAKLFTESDTSVVNVNGEIYFKAVSKYFSNAVSKKDTIFDCCVAAVADEYQADAIFSFDAFYKKKGFVLASELVKDLN